MLAFPLVQNSGAVDQCMAPILDYGPVASKSFYLVDSFSIIPNSLLDFSIELNPTREIEFLLEL